MENTIQAEHIPNFNNPKKNPIIISGDSNTIAEYLSQSDNANDSEYLMPILQTDFVMVSTYITNTPTLLISTPKSITDKDFSRLVARARHYGKYSWLKISPDGNTKRGKWPIRDKEFSFSN